MLPIVVLLRLSRIWCRCKALSRNCSNVKECGHVWYCSKKSVKGCIGMPSSGRTKRLAPKCVVISDLWGDSYCRTRPIWSRPDSTRMAWCLLKRSKWHHPHGSQNWNFLYLEMMLRKLLIIQLIRTWCEMIHILSWENQWLIIICCRHSCRWSNRFVSRERERLVGWYIHILEETYQLSICRISSSVLLLSMNTSSLVHYENSIRLVSRVRGY